MIEARFNLNYVNFPDENVQGIMVNKKLPMLPEVEQMIYFHTAETKKGSLSGEGKVTHIQPCLNEDEVFYHIHVTMMRLDKNS